MILPWAILGIFCAFFHTSNGSEGSQVFVGRQEFEVCMQDVNSKLDLILTALAKDELFVNTSRGTPGVAVSQGHNGIQRESLNHVTTRLGQAEKVLKKVRPEGLRNHILYGTQGGGLQIYSEEFNDVQTFVESSEDVEGVAWDDENQKLYYCSLSTIYRVNRDRTEIQTVFRDSSYGHLKGLALDWITGNLYAVARGGHVLACSPRPTGQLKCYSILSNQGELNSIALHPNEGLMYFTSNEGFIMTAEMDAWNADQLLGDLNFPDGIVTDVSSDPPKLFWVEYKGHVVKSCDLDGSNVVTILNLPSGSYPSGLAILKDRLYWGQYWDYSLHSSRKNGEDVTTLYTGSHRIQYLTVAASNPNSTRQNPCEVQQCSGICLLGRSNYTCFSDSNLGLESEPKEIAGKMAGKIALFFVSPVVFTSNAMMRDR